MKLKKRLAKSPMKASGVITKSCCYRNPGSIHVLSYSLFHRFPFSFVSLSNDVCWFSMNLPLFSLLLLHLYMEKKCTFWKLIFHIKSIYLNHLSQIFKKCLWFGDQLISKSLLTDNFSSLDFSSFILPNLYRKGPIKLYSSVIPPIFERKNF